MYFSYSGFGQPQAFNFQQSRTAGTGGVGTDLQTASQIDLSASEFPSLTNRSVPQPSIAPGIRNYGESPVPLVSLVGVCQSLIGQTLHYCSKTFKVNVKILGISNLTRQHRMVNFVGINICIFLLMVGLNITKI